MKDWQHQLYTGAQQQGQKPLYRFLSRRGALTRTLSYDTVWQEANGLAQILRREFKTGDRLLLLFEPELDFCVTLWACFLAGMVAIPLYPPADPRTRERFLDIARDAEASGILTTRSIYKKVKLARWLMPVFRRLRWIQVDDLSLPDPELLPSVPPEHLALLQYTSGSTEKPKGVMLTHQNFMRNSEMLDLASRMEGEFLGERCVSWLPLYHDMGLMCGVIQPVYFGSESILMSPLSFLQKPLRWLEAITTYRGTYAAAPNFAYDFCVKRIRAEQKNALDLRSWRFALNGAEPIRAETLRNFVEAFAPCGFAREAFFPAYGLAEATVFVSGAAVNQAPKVLQVSRLALQKGVLKPCSEASEQRDVEELVSVGQTYGGGKLCVVHPDSLKTLPEGEIGEVWLQSDSVGQGYWKKPERSREVFEATLAGASSGAEKWLRTGDFGTLYKGHLYITGRRKDVIILHGENHYPQRFERLAETAHDGFRKGCNAAFGVLDEKGEEKVVIIQEVRDNTSQSIAALTQALQEQVTEATRIPLHDVVLVRAGQIPKTSSGKVRRQETRQRYQKGKLKRWKM